MIEKVVPLEIQKAYGELKSILLKNNCRIIVEEQLKSIIVEHGYPSSFSPRETWKRISFYLFSEAAGTRIIGLSSIIFPIPVRIITYLVAGFFTLFLLGIFIPGLGTAALVGLIATFIVYEAYYHLHRKRDSFLEEVFRLLSQKAGNP